MDNAALRHHKSAAQRSARAMSQSRSATRSCSATTAPTCQKKKMPPPCRAPRRLSVTCATRQRHPQCTALRCAARCTRRATHREREQRPARRLGRGERRRRRSTQRRDASSPCSVRWLVRQLPPPCARRGRQHARVGRHVPGRCGTGCVRAARHRTAREGLLRSHAPTSGVFGGQRASRLGSKSAGGLKTSTRAKQRGAVRFRVAVHKAAAAHTPPRCGVRARTPTAASQGRRCAAPFAASRVRSSAARDRRPAPWCAVAPSARRVAACRARCAQC
jgi:hypothetical protein